MRRTKEQARETRAAILQSAEVLFLQKGFENVALDEVASAAGVTRGAVHWHFRNKQGLLFAIRDEMQQPMQELADRLLEDKALFPLDELADVISTSFRRLQADPRQRGLLRVLLQLDSREDADDQGGGDAFQRNLRSSLITVCRPQRQDAVLLDASLRRHLIPSRHQWASDGMGARKNGLPIGPRWRSDYQSNSFVVDPADAARGRQRGIASLIYSEKQAFTPKIYRQRASPIFGPVWTQVHRWNLAN